MSQKMTDCREIINEDAISETLATVTPPDAQRFGDLLDKSRACQGLERREVAELMAVTDPDHSEALLAAAAEIKSRIYGDRVVLFAPLYVSNECVGNCPYCAFRRDNTELRRRTLETEEIAAEVRWLIDHGYKRLLLVFGDNPRTRVADMVRAVETVYATHSHEGSIRRVNINAAPLSYEDFCTLKPAGLGTYQVFQETYHRATYDQAHTSGPKSGYQWRLTVWERCFPAGIDDMGLGVLYGLHDWRWDTLALLDHAAYLDRTFGVGPHTLSVPRIEPAHNAPWSLNPPAPVNDDDFKRIIALLRLAVPYTGIILSTREDPQMRQECLRLGVSQVSAGSRTSPGGYSEGEPHLDESQFSMGDHRNLDEVMRDLCEQGYLPSFCTACYRSGRTGQDFMALAKPGEIHHFCLPNALMTFKEYLLDYASPATRAIGEVILKQHLDKIDNENLRRQTEQKLQDLEEGKRDLYY